jgi:hypothetical protein
MDIEASSATVRQPRHAHTVLRRHRHARPPIAAWRPFNLSSTAWRTKPPTDQEEVDSGRAAFCCRRRTADTRISRYVAADGAPADVYTLQTPSYALCYARWYHACCRHHTLRRTQRL